jgi:hypothetical protein
VSKTTGRSGCAARSERNSATPSSPDVHVLDDQVDASPRDALQPCARRGRAFDLRAFERQQDVERRAHGVIVVDDQ